VNLPFENVFDTPLSADLTRINALCSMPSGRLSSDTINWLFAGSPDGAGASATFFRLIESAKAQTLTRQFILHLLHVIETFSPAP
jgi:hypothetical protein